MCLIKNSAISHLSFRIIYSEACAQSFMNLADSDSHSQIDASDEKLQRTDVWHLLFLSSVVDNDLHYENYSFASWESIETSSVQNSIARIRIYVLFKTSSKLPTLNLTARRRFDLEWWRVWDEACPNFTFKDFILIECKYLSEQDLPAHLGVINISNDFHLSHRCSNSH